MASMEHVRYLESVNASPEEIQFAYDEYWQKVDQERREANRLNRLYQERLAKEAREAREANK